MSNIKIKDADSAEKYLKATGAGTNADPFVSYNELSSVVSTDNSSTTLLTNGSTFTGTAELNDHPDVMVTVKTDQAGVLYMDFSPDGTNWDSTLSFNYDPTRINPPHILVKGKRYYRTRFLNNSGSDQTYLRLQTNYGYFQKLTAALNGTLAENYDAIVVRPTDYFSEVAMGKRQGRTLWNKFGYNLDVDAAAEEVITSWGGTFDPATDIISTAQTLTITYNNATDGLGTTGALSLLIYYIDENNLSAVATHTLSNTGSDVTSFTCLGVNRVVVLSSGSAGTNTNTITLTATTDTTTQAQIPAGGSVTQQCIFHNQINHYFLMNWMMINIVKISGGGGSPVVTIKAFSWSRVTNTKYEIFRHTIDTAVENSVEFTPKHPFILTGREVIYFTADTDTNNTVVTLRFSGSEDRVS